MLLDSLSVSLRLRTPWEATDLGLALLRRHARVIYTAWAALTFPILLVLTALGQLLDYPTVAVMLFWLLKPFFDQVPLRVLSGAVFGQVPPWRQVVIDSWRGLPAILPWLTWRRLGPRRALLLPVDLLERVKGPRRRERCAVISRGSGSTAVLLTVAGVHLEAMLYLSIGVFGLMFVPTEFLSEASRVFWENLIENPPAWTAWLTALMYWLALSVIEPLYVASGFALYLNRRTGLEGWDIELGFRDLKRRLAGLGRGLAMLALCLLPLFSFAPAHASPPAEAESPASEFQRCPIPGDVDAELGGLLGQPLSPQTAEFVGASEAAQQHPDLRPTETVKVWKRREPVEPDADLAKPLWAMALGEAFAVVVEHALWIAVGLLLLIGLWFAWKQGWLDVERYRGAFARGPATPTLGELPPEEVPLPPLSELPTRVLELWRQGHPRAALALAYRGTVALTGEGLGQPLPPGCTEAECLRALSGWPDPAEAGVLAALVRCWRNAAYGDRWPAESELSALLDRWPIGAGR
ncbi:MAG: DUF4129 domain-containing protein [Xanthomonadales bacterium]|jgi:hypothetical protein|nr:DUF4129 domain-containing protein [Xanthomonadales bacterium]